MKTPVQHITVTAAEAGQKLLQYLARRLGSGLPLAALQICERVDVVRVQELADYGTHPDPGWALPYGFGRPPGAPAPILGAGVPTLFWGGMVRLH